MLVVKSESTNINKPQKKKNKFNNWGRGDMREIRFIFFMTLGTIQHPESD
jgi:hypothetical protein